jgi:alkyl hydroperoxide reductase subunit F
MGHEFTSLLLALLWAGGHPPKVEPEVVEQIKALDGDFDFTTWMSLTCHNCPDVVQALNLMAVLNPRVRHVAIDGGLFQAGSGSTPDHGRAQDRTQRRRLRQRPHRAGRDPGQDRHRRRRREAAKLSAKAPFDVLIIGGGPAGAAAAVYAARKGIRTGIVAERFGGQTMDTLGIENFISVLETEGPEVRRRAGSPCAPLRRGRDDAAARGALDPARSPAACHRGAGQRRRAEGRAVILATGARWRNMNVPGEAEYRTKGVAYCPHCDGPLFKGKDVAVIGGGNSGVEAAIDLAGVVKQRHAAGVCRPAEGRPGAGRQAQEPAQRDHPRQRADHRGAPATARR